MRKLFFILIIVCFIFTGLWGFFPVNPMEGGEKFFNVAYPGMSAGRSVTGGSFDISLPSYTSLNPALAGGEQRIVLNAGYLILKDLEKTGIGHSGELGVSVPTRWAVISSNLGFTSSKQDGLYYGTSGFFDLAFSKDLFENFYVGLGLHSAFGSDWAFSGSLGVVYLPEDFSIFKDIRIGASLTGLGKGMAPSGATGVRNGSKLTGIPSAVTPEIGASAVLLDYKKFKIGGWTDFAFPSVSNFLFGVGLQFAWNNSVFLSTDWDFNLMEAATGHSLLMPAFSLGVKIKLNNPESDTFIGRNGWNKSELTPSLIARPVTDSVWAFGGGLNVHLGVKDTNPPEIKMTYKEGYSFSPNNDGINDELIFDVSVIDSRYVTSWAFIVTDEDGNEVKRIENKEKRPENETFGTVMKRLVTPKQGIDLPSSIRWDGIMDSGEVAPDGVYYFRMEAVDDNGNKQVTPVYQVEIDVTPPSIQLFGMISPYRVDRPENSIPAGLELLSSSLGGTFIAQAVNSLPDPGTPKTPARDLIFSPDGDGNKDFLRIPQKGTKEDLWTGTFYTNRGTPVRTFTWKDSEPETLVWDGKDDNGVIVPDGIYYYVISAVDKAGNKVSARLDNIIVNTEKPSVNLTIDYNYFAPGTTGSKNVLPVRPSVPVTKGLVSWDIQIVKVENSYNDGTVVRAFTGNGEAPSEFNYDGKTATGAVLAEGEYQAVLTVYYENGYQPVSASPVFTVDVTAPEARVSSDTGIFSPNGDGNLDRVVFSQTASSEALWEGKILDSRDNVVRLWKWTGEPAEKLEWDGLDKNNELLPDGVYRYVLVSEDRAGNTGGSKEVSITLNTEEAEVMIYPSLNAFSPNGDGVKDTLSFNVTNKGNTGILTYKLSVYSENNQEVHSWTGDRNLPSVFTWDGEGSPDGRYFATIEVSYANGNQASATSSSILLDRVFPEGSTEVDTLSFSPNGDGKKDQVNFKQSSKGTDNWKGEIFNSESRLVRTFHWNGQLKDFAWNGTDEAGNILPDGIYSYVLTSEDEAGNKTTVKIPEINLDSRIPKAYLTAELSGISPNNDGIKDQQVLNPVASITTGIESWQVSVFDVTGKKEVEVFTWAGTKGEGLPESIKWDGKDYSGLIVRGNFIAKLSLVYEKGDVLEAYSSPFIVNGKAPELSVSLSPKYFSPDNDGVDDDLYISLSAKSISPFTKWSFEIKEPQGAGLTFWKAEGTTSITPRIIWDGKSNKGELVQAATDYPYVFTVADDLGNVSVTTGYIPVDILVIRQGENLKIQVPSIIFRENNADFIGLPAATVEKNEQVLKRVAEILNKFKDYRVVIEGHANNVTGTQKEEEEDLLPLSNARAEAVMKILSDYGVNSSRLSTVGRGGTQPVVPRSDRNNWWKNRRVEFILIK